MRKQNTFLRFRNLIGGLALYSQLSHRGTVVVLKENTGNGGNGKGVKNLFNFNVKSKSRLSFRRVENSASSKAVSLVWLIKSSSSWRRIMSVLSTKKAGVAG